MGEPARRRRIGCEFHSFLPESSSWCQGTPEYYQSCESSVPPFPSNRPPGRWEHEEKKRQENKTKMAPLPKLTSSKRAPNRRCDVAGRDDRLPTYTPGWWSERRTYGPLSILSLGYSVLFIGVCPDFTFYFFFPFQPRKKKTKTKTEDNNNIRKEKQKQKTIIEIIEKKSNPKQNFLSLSLLFVFVFVCDLFIF